MPCGTRLEALACACRITNMCRPLLARGKGGALVEPDDTMASPEVSKHSRRDFLQRTLGGAAAVGMGGLLAACGSSTTATTTTRTTTTNQSAFDKAQAWRDASARE